MTQLFVIGTSCWPLRSRRQNTRPAKPVQSRTVPATRETCGEGATEKQIPTGQLDSSDLAKGWGYVDILGYLHFVEYISTFM